MRSSAMRVPILTIMASMPLDHKARTVFDHGRRRFVSRQCREPQRQAFPRCVSGVFINVRRPESRPNMSTATVRAGSRLRRTAALRGVLAQRCRQNTDRSTAGFPPSSVFTPAAVQPFAQLTAAVLVRDPCRFRQSLCG